MFQKMIESAVDAINEQCGFITAAEVSALMTHATVMDYISMDNGLMDAPVCVKMETGKRYQCRLGQLDRAIEKLESVKGQYVKTVTVMRSPAWESIGIEFSKN